VSTVSILCPDGDGPFWANRGQEARADARGRLREHRASRGCIWSGMHSAGLSSLTEGLAVLDQITLRQLRWIPLATCSARDLVSARPRTAN
jgi:hypothetical protein